MILITGANGYVGGFTLKQLQVSAAKLGNEKVLGLVRDENRAAKVRNAGAEPIFGDVTDVESLHKAMQEVPVIVTPLIKPG